LLPSQEGSQLQGLASNVRPEIVQLRLSKRTKLG
jgi:hypothetical protein